MGQQLRNPRVSRQDIKMALIKAGNQAAFDKRFGNTKGNKTVNGGVTTTGMGKLASSGLRPKKMGSKHK